MYLLTGKLFCGMCGKPMVGESGRSHTGVNHYYYKCGAAKRKQGCRKKAIRKQLIEDLVIKQMIRLLWSDTIIEHIADLMLKTNNMDSTILPKLSAQLADVQKRLNNLLKAVEVRIFNDTTQQRMTELERQRKYLEIEIAKEKLKKTKYYTRDFDCVVATIPQIKCAKRKPPSYSDQLFLNAVYVYDDKLTLTFNYRDSAETISLSQVEGSDLSRCAPPAKNLYYPLGNASFLFYVAILFKILLSCVGKHLEFPVCIGVR